MLRALIKTLRIRQWTKNGFVLMAVVFDQKLTNLDAVERSLAAFAVFCLLSSAVYIFNDIRDIEADRQHPTKRNRPIASGALPVPVAYAEAGVLLAIIAPIAYLLSPIFSLICLAYLLINVAYSIWLKHIPVLDVLIVAAGFVLRVGSGVSVIQVERFSPWLYLVMLLLALYMGFGKRRAELQTLAESANQHRRVLDGYTIPFLDQMIIIVSSTTIISYSLYTFSAPNLPEDHSMMLTIPFVLYGIFRYLYLIQVKHEGGAPEELLLTDHPLQLSVVLCALLIFLIFYIIH
jgi:4-hydroxybenzoate polyprenyltransferase